MSGSYATISQWGSIRLAVGAAMFITYFLFICAYWYSDFKQKDRPKLYVQMTSLATKMYLFGMACLFSMNFLQAGVFQTVFSYFTMVSIILVIVFSIFSQIGQKIRIISIGLFYLFLSIWYMGIMIDYFVANN